MCAGTGTLINEASILRRVGWFRDGYSREMGEYRLSLREGRFFKGLTDLVEQYSSIRIRILLSYPLTIKRSLQAEEIDKRPKPMVAEVM